MQVAPIQRYVSCATPTGLHRLGYLEWGDPANPNVVICVHGLTRCARDFDALARALVDRYRVICPDMPGRGSSDWLKNPAEYEIPVYVSDCVTLIARLDVEQVDWVGTSMGGLIGMALASMPGAPIRRLVLNDAGPVLSALSLARIGQYVGNAPRFPDFNAAVQYIRTVAAPFGPHTDEEWHFLTEVVVRKQADETYIVHYDPALSIPFRKIVMNRDIELWHLYDAVRAKTLVIRGAESDLLPRATAEQMRRRGPMAEVVEFEGIGHAPTLMHDDQTAVVRDFLLRA
ncbi:MAG: alpha/beta fold hydrolase [Burkholderiales bacterium]